MKYEELVRLINSGEMQKTVKVLTTPNREINKDDILKQYEVKKHKIMDVSHRPDKIVNVTTDDGKTESKLQSVVRVAIPYQKSIVKIAASFLLANPVRYVSSESGNDATTISTIFNRLSNKLKLPAFDLDIAKDIFSLTECAEYWYVIKEQNQLYGQNAGYKIKVARFSAKDNELYPLFDDHGDMIAFSRKFKMKNENNEDVEHLETYTKDYIYKFEKKANSAEFELISSQKITIGKIPIVYGSQEEPEWEDVQNMIERLEDINSDHGEINDYHTDPKLVAKGEVKSFASKGEKGKIIEMETEGDLKYLAWDHSIESMKSEKDNLERLVFSLTQTPKIDFDSVQGLGNLSGVALRLLFLSPYLKATEKKNKFEEYFERRISIITSLLKIAIPELTNQLGKVEINPVITPFMINDQKELVELLLSATGNKALISQKTAIGLTGLVENVTEEQKLIEEQQQRDELTSITEPSF